MLIALVLAASVAAIVERVPGLRFRSLRFFRSYLVIDLLYLLTGFVAGGSLALSYVTRGSQFFGDLLSVPRLASLSLPLWISFILALLALDAGNYTAHYCLHRFGWLWEFHKIHHSSRELNWLATLRSHILEP